MPLHTRWKRSHSSTRKPIIHKTNIPRLSLLLQETFNLQPNLNAKLVTEEFTPPDQGTSSPTPPVWSPFTTPGSSTSDRAPPWSPITPQSPASGLLPGNTSASNFAPPIAAVHPLPEIATFSETAINAKTAVQQKLVKVYGEAALRLVSISECENQVCVRPTFEELPVRPGHVGLGQLPGLRALGLDVLYEFGQMDVFTWRSRLFGQRYGRAKSAEGFESAGKDENAESGGIAGGSKVEGGDGQTEDAAAGGAASQNDASDRGLTLGFAGIADGPVPGRDFWSVVM